MHRPEWNLLREKFEAALNPSRQGANQDSATGKFAEINRSPHYEGNGEECSHNTLERNRAVIRTPELVQDLYRGGLINKVEASLLGAKHPDPEKQQRIEKTVQRLQSIVEASPTPTLKAEKNAVKKQINQAVREEMGVVTKSIAIAATMI